MSTLPPHAPHYTARPWSRRTELAALVGFWMLLGTLTVLRRALDARGGAGIATPDVALALSEYVLWAFLTPTIFYVAHRWPIDREALGRRLVLHLALAFLIAAAVDLVRVVLTRPLLFHGSAGQRGVGLNAVLGALARLQFLDELVIYLAVLAAGFARDYFLRYREHQEEAARLEAQLSEARLSALRMQLNPHFLFNTLHAISALVERDPQGVRRIIARLSALLRHVLEEGDAQEVPLRKELEFLRGYLAIQRVRFRGRLEVEEDVAPDTLDALVPNLILQPLVENAVKHGVGALEAGTGRIVIRAQRDGDQLVLAVQDNGPGMPTADEDPVEGVGLRNTRARLEGLYGSEPRLAFQPGNGGGVVATIALPFHTRSDLHTDVVPSSVPPPS